MFNSPLTFNDLSRSTQTPAQSSSTNQSAQTANSESTSYLPGYLSSAARGSSIPVSTPPRQETQSSHAHSSSQQSLSRSPLSTSQSSAHHTPNQSVNHSVSGGAFGAGSLFGSISTPLSKSPRNSLYGRLEDDQEAPPTMFLQDEDNVHQFQSDTGNAAANTAAKAPSQHTNAPSAKQIHNLTPWHHAPQPTRIHAPLETRSVTFFGIGDNLRARMMDVFIPQFGQVESVSDGVNWIDAVFADTLAASRAIKWNGVKVDDLGGVMLGVKLTHGGSEEHAQSAPPSQHHDSKHLTPLPPSQAFKPSPKPQSSTASLRTMFNSPSANKSSNEYGISAQQVQPQQSGSSWGGKLADLIFGF
ncbi:hypothetical protein E3P92_02834 [Wallemia ichthyophaga]|nr:hypothetical protein E3P92_02834 [Wallemia ichthyophaga]TIB61626.1 hypothetical protein E3P78_02732 [Wallemia ichthyophaga]